MGSRVPPAVTTTLIPDMHRSLVSVSRLMAAAKMSSGSGRRPGPLSAPVRRPSSGFMTVTPRLRNVATFDCVAGCCHISVCIAGAMRTGQRAVNSTLLSRSSASP